MGSGSGASPRQEQLGREGQEEEGGREGGREGQRKDDLNGKSEEEI